MIPIIPRSIAVACALLLSATAAAQSTSNAPSGDSTEVARVETIDVTLTISRLERAGGPRVFRVRAGDDVVFGDSMSYAVLVHTVTRWAGGWVALLQIASGGSSCPSMYRVVEMPGDGPPRASPEFGTCSDLPVVLLDETRFRVRFPGFYQDHMAREPGFRPPPAATWEYLGDGRVRRVTGTAATAPR